MGSVLSSICVECFEASIQFETIYWMSRTRYHVHEWMFSFAPAAFCCSRQPEENSIKQWFHLLMCTESNYNGWFLFLNTWHPWKLLWGPGGGEGTCGTWDTVKPALGCGYISCFIFCAWKNSLLLWPVTEYKCVLLEGVQFETQSVGSQVSFSVLLSFITQGGHLWKKWIQMDTRASTSSCHTCKYEHMQTHLVYSDPEISVEWAPWTDTDTHLWAAL